MTDTTRRLKKQPVKPLQISFQVVSVEFEAKTAKVEVTPLICDRGKKVDQEDFLGRVIVHDDFDLLDEPATDYRHREGRALFLEGRWVMVGICVPTGRELE